MTIRSIQALAVSAAIVFAGSAFALGGNDQDGATKVNKDTEKCSKTIAAKGALYVGKRMKAIGACLDGALKCDEQADESKAIACREKLLVPDKGACAVGKLDGGSTTIGAGSSAGVSKTDKPTINKELGKLKDAINKACFAAGKEAELVDAMTGLGFPGPAPANADELMDLINNENTGVSCAANRMVFETTPIVPEITFALSLVDDDMSPGLALVLREENGSLRKCMDAVAQN